MNNIYNIFYINEDINLVLNNKVESIKMKMLKQTLKKNRK